MLFGACRVPQPGSASCLSLLRHGIALVAHNQLRRCHSRHVSSEARSNLSGVPRVRAAVWSADRPSEAVRIVTVDVRRSGQSPPLGMVLAEARHGVRVKSLEPGGPVAQAMLQHADPDVQGAAKRLSGASPSEEAAMEKNDLRLVMVNGIPVLAPAQLGFFESHAAQARLTFSLCRPPPATVPMRTAQAAAAAQCPTTAALNDVLRFFNTDGPRTTLVRGQQQSSAGLNGAQNWASLLESTPTTSTPTTAPMQRLAQAEKALESNMTLLEPVLKQLPTPPALTKKQLQAMAKVHLARRQIKSLVSELDKAKVERATRRSDSARQRLSLLSHAIQRRHIQHKQKNGARGSNAAKKRKRREAPASIGQLGSAHGVSKPKPSKALRKLRKAEQELERSMEVLEPVLKRLPTPPKLSRAQDLALHKARIARGLIEDARKRLSGSDEAATAGQKAAVAHIQLKALVEALERVSTTSGGRDVGGGAVAVSSPPDPPQRTSPAILRL